MSLTTNDPDMPTESKALSPAEWEALCDRCGLCCQIPGTAAMCKGYDVETKMCTVYNKRHDTYPCLPVTPSNVLSLHERGILPDSCAYVTHTKGQPRKEPPAVVMVPYEKAPQFVKDHFESETRTYLKSRRASSKTRR